MSWWISGPAFVAGTAAVVVFVSRLSGGRLEQADRLSSLVGLMIGAGGLLLSEVRLWIAIRQGRASRGRVGPADAAVLDRAVRDLAGALLRQWSAEAARLCQPADELVAVFRRQPCRPLVILGGRGVGKTAQAVSFTVELLATRAPVEPVPVLLAVSSWNPCVEELEDWLALRLAETYPALVDFDGHGDVVARLVAAGLVTPVLDGLDELSGQLRAAAVDGINRFAGDHRRVVVACDSDVYVETVAITGPVWPGVTVVELAPVEVGDAVAYIPDFSSAYRPERVRRWLVFLARETARRGTGDLGWWQLAGVVPWPVRVVVVASAVGLGAGLVAGHLGGTGAGLQGGAVFGLVAGIVASLASAQVPGSTAGFGRWEGRRPALFGLIVGVMFGVGVGTAFGSVAGVVAGTGLGCTSGLAEWLQTPPPLIPPPSPATALRAARATAVMEALAGGVGFGAVLGLGIGQVDGLVAGAVAAVVVATFTPWGEFAMARVWGAVSGRLPLRLMRFLSDAHRLGVLRQVGARYQFRHVALRDRLCQSEGSAVAHGA